MLTLTRRVGESIIIGDDIVVMVTGARNDKVWLGIDAPSHVVVDREEVHLAKQRNGALRPVPSARRPDEGED